MRRIANDEWRKDPERIEEWRVEMTRRGEVIEEAWKHLQAAKEAFRHAPAVWNPNGGYDSIYTRLRDDVFRVEMTFERDAPWVMEKPTQQLLENYAAFGRPGE
jgi:hypothetical protein